MGDSLKRASFPVAMRTSGIDVNPTLDEKIRRGLERRLRKFAAHIERVTVRFEDVNGPRGGRDTVCRIKAVIPGRPTVVVAERAGDAVESFNRADHRVERAVKRAIARGRYPTVRR